MDNREQQVRERAYKIWQDEGQEDGAHDEHWRRAEAEHELTEKESEDVTKANQQADDKFAKDSGTKSSGDIASLPLPSSD